MRETALPPGFVMWPDNAAQRNRLCVLISDVHCTDCTVGNQTASETDWRLFFDQVEFAVCNPGEKAQISEEQRVDELLLILNGDILDLIRSAKWAQADVYPWQRDDPRFAEIVLAIMHDIVDIHARARPPNSKHHYSGFFYWMRKSLDTLRAQNIAVTIVPIVGNHDKELQVVPAARRIFYEECLGLGKLDIADSYRAWVAAQLGVSPDDPYPCMPFYFADSGLRLLATHGQWRDADNARATSRWDLCKGWAPQQWREEQYQAFSEPCFGDTVAAAMLSRFIWSTHESIDMTMPGAAHIYKLLHEMDLYRPSVAAVVRLLRESRHLARCLPQASGLHDIVLRCFRESLRSWLGHSATWECAWGSTKIGLIVLSCLSRLRWHWLDMLLMRLMARAQEPESSISTCKLLALPAFKREYRALGLRLHVEGHTHAALAVDLQFPQTRMGRNNYTYINLGAWRDTIFLKRNRGHRKRGIGRALFIFDLARLSKKMPNDSYRFYVRDMTSWGDRLDNC